MLRKLLMEPLKGVIQWDTQELRMTLLETSLVRQDFAWFAFSQFFWDVHAVHLIYVSVAQYVFEQVWTRHMTVIFTSLQITCTHFKCFLNVSLSLFLSLPCSLPLFLLSFLCTWIWNIEGTEVPFYSNFKESRAGITWRNCRWVTEKQRLRETC